MRIAYLYDCVYPYKIGGIERRVFELARRLTQRGHEVHLFGMKFWEGEKTIGRDGIIIHGLCPVPPLYPGGRRAILPALSYAGHLIAPLLRQHFDIIDAQQFPYFHCYSAKIASISRKTPLVITWHEIWGDYWFRYLGSMGFFGQAVEWGVARLSRNMVAVSPSTAGDLRNLGCKGNITIIPNGIDPSYIGSIQSSPVTSDVIFAGRFIREKNVDLLIAALGLLRDGMHEIRAVIIGDGPERESLHGMVHDHGLDNNVTFTGFLHDPDAVIALMKSSKVFVFPSTREGFGMAALEAMACGLPVVTVDYQKNATRDLVSPETGVIARCEKNDIASKIRDCFLSTGQKRQKCIAAAAAYDWDMIVSRTEHYYERVIEH